MYAELYRAWQREIEESALQPLPADFFTRVSEYLKRIHEETQSPEKKTVQESLLGQEARNVTRIVKELLRLRYKKLLMNFSGGQKLPSDLLTSQEAEIFVGFIPFSEACRAFAEGILQGQDMKSREEPSRKRVLVRFLKDIPAIIGGDMKPYGPFKAEDVGTVPAENAKLLVKQGLAEVVAVS